MSKNEHSAKGRKSLIKLVEDDGWYLARVRGSHNQYKHPVKSGLITIPRKITKNIELSVRRQAGLK